MKKILLLIHGPNLNLLGNRDKEQYGELTLKELVKKVTTRAKDLNMTIRSFQSNHEGELIDFLQKNTKKAHGIIINPGALAHYSYALHDAIIDTQLPCIEVHLSDISTRESWRQVSVTAPACLRMVSGKKEKGYDEAVEILSKNI